MFYIARAFIALDSLHFNSPGEYPNQCVFFFHHTNTQYLPYKSYKLNGWQLLLTMFDNLLGNIFWPCRGASMQLHLQTYIYIFEWIRTTLHCTAQPSRKHIYMWNVDIWTVWENRFSKSIDSTTSIYYAQVNDSINLSSISLMVCY